MFEINGDPLHVFDGAMHATLSSSCLTSAFILIAAALHCCLAVCDESLITSAPRQGTGWWPA